MCASCILSTLLCYQIISNQLQLLLQIELRDLQEQQKKQEDQNNYENLVANALTTWNKEILPNWENTYVSMIK